MKIQFKNSVFYKKYITRRSIKYRSYFGQKTRSIKNSGFTMVEVLVAIFILSVAISSSVFLISFNYRNATTIKNYLIASGLAQEGIEIVRSIRDQDWYSGVAFGTSLQEGVSYKVQWNSQALAPLAAGPDNLKIDNTTGLYNYDSGTETIFRRWIVIVGIEAGVSIKVRSYVSWQERGGPFKSIEIQEYLHNWK